MPVGSRTVQAETSVENADGEFLEIFSQCKGFIKGFNLFQPWFSLLLNRLGGLISETGSICAVFCAVEPDEDVLEPGGIEDPPKLPARFGGPILRSPLQRTFMAMRQSSSSVEEQQLYQLWLHGASCLSAMLQVGPECDVETDGQWLKILMSRMTQSFGFMPYHAYLKGCIWCG